MDRRGQINSLDLVIATLIFVGILVTAVYLWSDTIKSIGRSNEKSDLNSKVRDVSEVLVKTPGEPPTWHRLAAQDIKYPRVRSLGLSDEDNILNPEKIDKFGQLDYEEARYLMGLSREGYNITIINSSGGVTHSFGEKVHGQIASSERLVLISGEKNKVRVGLFTQEV